MEEFEEDIDMMKWSALSPRLRMTVDRLEEEERVVNSRLEDVQGMGGNMTEENNRVGHTCDFHRERVDRAWVYKKRLERLVFMNKKKVTWSEWLDVAMVMVRHTR